MPEDDRQVSGRSEEGQYGSDITETPQEESQALLSRNSLDDTEQPDGLSKPDLNKTLPPRPTLFTRPPPIKRQSSLSHPPPNGQPRTPRVSTRVRFDFDNLVSSPDDTQANGNVRESSNWVDEDDYLDETDSARQTAPLISGITAPSDSPFLDDSFQPEDHLPDARPKSGMRSAFMNMANSIIGAGIIGQPYAFRQAGLTMGIILLVGLTITVDWTVRLIVINSKLSGADSFQATVQHCFGHRGLIAISIAQWAFAFGGMVAFCVIVGDTIPHVLEAIVPGLKDMSFLWLFTDRRFAIVFFVLGISWPLSLYRDIAKVRLSTLPDGGKQSSLTKSLQLSKASTLALLSMCVIVISVMTQGIRVPAETRGNFRGLLFVSDGFFQAVGVISFGKILRVN